MKRISLVIILIISLLLNCVSACAAYETCKVNASSLYCRTQPNTRSEIITSFARGTELRIVGADGAWWQVYDGNNQGWCHSTYLTLSNHKTEQNMGIAGKYIGDFKISYYTCSPYENGGCDLTATGHKLTDVVNICIAADPNIIPYYSKVYIEGVGIRTVLDCGGAIKGNKIDVLVGGNNDIPQCGIHHSKVYLLD